MSLKRVLYGLYCAKYSIYHSITLGFCSPALFKAFRDLSTSIPTTSLPLLYGFYLATGYLSKVCKVFEQSQEVTRSGSKYVTVYKSLSENIIVKTLRTREPARPHAFIR